MVPVFCLGNSSNCYQNFSQKHGCLLMHTEIAVPTNEPQTLSGSVCRAMHFYGIGVFLISFLISFIAILVVLSQARGLYKRFVNATGFLGDQQWAMIKTVEQRVIFYPIAFFCCWCLPASCLRWTKPQRSLLCGPKSDLCFWLAKIFVSHFMFFTGLKRSQ
uniref:Transmembrane protein 116 n=1 Tax=Strix occidentalis caurina TaxID=311401 RepID=A0A8D0F2U4_STROC